MALSDRSSALASRFAQAPYDRALGIRVESIERDSVRIRVPYSDFNSNPGRALHGGAIASTIGIAGALAAWSGFDSAPHLETGTLDLSVNYLAAAIGEDIIATAEVLRRGKEIVYSDVDVRTGAEKRIARGLVTYRGAILRARPHSEQRQLHHVSQAFEPADVEIPPMASALVSLPFISRLGITIAHMMQGHAVLEMPFLTENTDAAGAVHEGAIAALIDTTGAMAAWSLVGLDFRFKASTVGIHVNYHSASRGEALVASAQTLRRNEEIFLNRVDVSGRNTGRLIAAGTVTYRIVVPD